MYIHNDDGKQNVYRNYIMHIKMAHKRMNVCLPLFLFNEGVETPAWDNRLFYVKLLQFNFSFIYFVLGGVN